MNLIKAISNFMTRKYRREELLDTLQGVSFDPVENKRPSNIREVAFVMPAAPASSGGGTSLYRIARYLSEKGCHITFVIYAPDEQNQLGEVEKANVALFGSFSGRTISFETAKKEAFDVVIATTWNSTYYAKHLSGYKFYFVQDYEPYFFEVSDEYFLAQQSYRLGFHMISLGPWNAEQIRKNCPGEELTLDTVDFPYNPDEYPFRKRDFASYKDKKTIKIAAYIKGYGRRIPTIIQWMMTELATKLASHNITLEVSYFGFHPAEKVVGGQNLGQLDKKQLNDLYASSDFGLVASMTNISLVPYEMLSTGLPLIEFEQGSYSSFLGSDTAILTDFDAGHLCEKILRCLEDPSLLETMQKRAGEELQKTSWTHTLEQFWEIVSSVQEKKD